MSLKIIKRIIFIILVINTNIPVSADWLDGIVNGLGNMVIDGVDASAQSEIQKALIDVKNVHFSTEIRDKFYREGQKFGLSNPVVNSGIAKIQQDFKPKSSSPFITYDNLNPLKMADGYLYPFYLKMIQHKKEEADKNNLSDYLSENTIHILSAKDPEGLLTSNLLAIFNKNIAYATYIDLNPNVIELLLKDIEMIGYIDLDLLHYFSTDMNEHACKFKNGIILNPYNLNFDVIEGKISLSSNKGQLAIFELDSNVLIGDDISLLNCQLPPSSNIKFNNTNIKTDKLGRIETIEINVIKNKYKDLFKRTIKTSQILDAKNRSNSKALYLHPKEIGGVETWSNIFAIDDSKENKESLKQLNKWIKENNKSVNKKLTVKLKYTDSTDQPNSIQYFDGNNIICSVR